MLTFCWSFPCRALNTSQLKALNINMLPGYQDPYSSRVLTRGEIGCFLSHYYIWEEVMYILWVNVCVREKLYRVTQGSIEPTPGGLLCPPFWDVGWTLDHWHMPQPQPLERWVYPHSIASCLRVKEWISLESGRLTEKCLVVRTNALLPAISFPFLCSQKLNGEGNVGSDYWLE